MDRDWLTEALQSASESAGASDSNDSRFSIVTWNIWFSPYEWQARLKAVLIESIIHHDCPDVLCFQEVTTYVHSHMLGCQWLRDRYHPTEQKLPHSYDCSMWIKKDHVWVSTSIPLPSIYGRRGLCADLETKHKSRIRVVTTHLESGREMAATREKQLRCLFPCIQKTPWHDHIGVKNATTTPQEQYPHIAFLVGDFNLDPSYPENKIIVKSYKGLDLWSCVKPAFDPGWTEDTLINEMRYLAHGKKHKQARYDRIIMIHPHNPNPQEEKQKTDDSAPSGQSLTWKPQIIEILGTEPFNEEKSLWPSDHFGLVATVRFS